MLNILIPRMSQATVIGIYTEPTGEGWCVSTIPGPRLVDLHVVVINGPALSSISFLAPVPYCSGVWSSDVPVFPQTTGDSQNWGISINFGNCLEPPIHVLTIQMYLAWSNECCEFKVEPIDFRDCAGVQVGAGSDYFRITNGLCEPIAPHDPFPQDQAQEMPLSVYLDWSGEFPHCCLLGEIPNYSVFFGTTTDPPLVNAYILPPYNPGPLLPNTTYYWRVAALWHLSGKLGPLWTFKTLGGVPTETTTWGRIKGLYE
jgi:hypothetical protein